ncbi:alcohol dehydrogenase catalytic domain-containing protein [Lentzea sp. NPDC004782]|uniref:alcohol dehydrogenase catalytic domain-containing protein n=1 Tax=Lentzea sp. NPDC004782 TaxID=3154458 RepID=UPI0033AE0A17
MSQDGVVHVDDVYEPQIEQPTDVVVKVVAAAVCGTDLWMMRGIAPVPRPVRTGHEFVGVVVECGTDVRGLRPGTFVIAPFQVSDGVCPECLRGLPIACWNRRFFGEFDDGEALDGGQAEFVRVPFAEATLLALADQPDPALVPQLLTLTDVMPTGYEAARHAGVQSGASVVVVGDGAVAQCAIMASKWLGAEQIVVMSTHPSRQALARKNGATDVVGLRGDDGATAVRDLLDGGADHVIDAVGTLPAMRQAIGCARPGGRIGYVGLPWNVELPLWELFGKNLVLSGGGANVRTVMPTLLPAVLAGDLNPGVVFDSTFPLAQASDAYLAMNQRQSVKSMLLP